MKVPRGGDLVRLAASTANDGRNHRIRNVRRRRRSGQTLLDLVVAAVIVSARSHKLTAPSATAAGSSAIDCRQRARGERLEAPPNACAAAARGEARGGGGGVGGH